MTFKQLWDQYWVTSLELQICATDSVLYMFLLKSFEELRKMPIGHSDRYLAVRLGFSKTTIRESKKRLESYGMIKCETPDIKSRNVEGQTRFYLLQTAPFIDPVPDPVKEPAKKTVSVTGSIYDPQVDPVLQKNIQTAPFIDPVPDPNTILIDNTILSNNTVLSNIPNTNVLGQTKKPESPKKEKDKEEKKPSAQKKEESTPHWQTMVDTWFLFYEGKFNHKPSFAGSDPRDFKNIISRLQARAGMKGMEWTDHHAQATLNMFLDVAIEDKWLKDNFLLSNLNRQFDKIITYANSKANGETGRGNLQSTIQKLNDMYPSY